MIRRRALASLCLLLAAPVTLAAQASRCELIGNPNNRQTADTLMGGRSFVGGGVLVKCPSRGITLRGDSAEIYKDRYYVVGHVSYNEPRFSMTSDFLNYFVVDDRVVAAGNVHAKLPSGSTLVGPQAEYDRPIPNRPDRRRRQVRAIARPTITIVQPDSQGKPQPPMTVVATTVFMDGDSLIYGSGQVVITRPNITATADSAFIDQGRETMRLMRNPQLNGKKDRAFTLTGDVIDMYSKNRKLTRVLARAHARAVSDSLTLKSDTIDLRVTDDVLNHAYAWGTGSRAQAVSPSQNLTADSLDVTMPNQQVRLVRALRTALAQGKPADTARFHLVAPDTVDWLAGDTITAHFDTAATKDTTRTPVIRRLVADGHAAAWYHMAPSDTSVHLPAINQVSARVITIDFDNQKVATVTARDSVQGIYVEPQPDSTARKAKAAQSAKPGQAPAKKPPAGQKPDSGAVPSRVPLPPKRP
ncbi:MAG TPA: hypothetical protein VHB25_05210 [Gemmatimonadaceae bacterium]|nr:hypothetical protein [Gemmatimonadaceae bacterium]